MFLIFLMTRVMVRSIPPGESSRGAANAGAVTVKTTKTSVAILSANLLRIHPPYGSEWSLSLNSGGRPYARSDRERLFPTPKVTESLGAPDKSPRRGGRTAAEVA